MDDVAGVAGQGQVEGVGLQALARGGGEVAAPKVEAQGGGLRETM